MSRILIWNENSFLLLRVVMHVVTVTICVEDILQHSEKYPQKLSSGQQLLYEWSHTRVFHQLVHLNNAPHPDDIENVFPLLRSENTSNHHWQVFF